MSDQSSSPTATTVQPFVLTRAINAPRERVFQVWTEADHLRHWWGPVGFTMVHCAIDLRPDGRFLYGMRGADGGELWAFWRFREITPPQRLVFTVSFADREGTPVRAFFSDDWPIEMLATIDFAEQEGRTTLTLTSVPVDATEAGLALFTDMFASMTEGWGGTLDQLDAYLARA